MYVSIRLLSFIMALCVRLIDHKRQSFDAKPERTTAWDVNMMLGGGSVQKSG